MSAESTAPRRLELSCDESRSAASARSFGRTHAPGRSCRELPDPLHRPDERGVSCCTDRVEELHQRSQSLLVLRADEHHAMFADVLLYMLSVIVPVVRLECVLDQRTIERGEPIRRLFDKLDEV